MPRSNKRVRIWTYAEAAQAVPFVRGLLTALRQHYIAAWHFYRLNRSDPDGSCHRAEIEFHRQEGAAPLGEIKRLGVLPYHSPHRGIGLFPFFVHCGQGSTQREAFFVYKDSREEIDSFIFNDELCTHNDLLGWEMPVPEGWKGPGAVPTLDEEAKP